MSRQVAFILLLLLPAVLFSQNLDIKHTAFNKFSGKHFLQIIFSGLFQIRKFMLHLEYHTGMAAAGLIKDDKELLRNACVTSVQQQLPQV